ncbi:MAG: GDSL-type esterase/lipase family protein [Kofleriaceae bacterium]
MAAKLLVSLNGGGPSSGGIRGAAVGDTVQLSAQSKAGWGTPTALWEIYGYPDGFACPAGWSVEDVSTDPAQVYYYRANTPDPPEFTLSVWGKYMLRLTSNGGDARLDGAMDETTAIDVTSPNGLHDLGRLEGAQFSTTHMWAEDQQENLRKLEGALAAAAPIPAQAVDLDTVDDIILVGDSNTAGFAANLSNATGYREAFQEELVALGYEARFMGPHGYGALSGTGTTWGRFPSATDFHGETFHIGLTSWAHHGEYGRKMSASFTLTGVNTGTEVLTATGHDMQNGSMFVVSSTGTVPGGLSAGTAYFAGAVSGNDLKATLFEGSTSYVNLTSAGAGTITIGTGLAQLVPATFAALPRAPKTVLLMAGTNDVSALVDTAASNQLATLQARMTALLDAIEEAAPDAERIIVSSILPFYSGATNYADKATLAASFNAWLATYVPTRGSQFTYVDGAAGFGAGLMSSDGVHPTREGYRLLARNFAEAYRKMRGPVPRVPAVPGYIAKRAPKASLKFAGGTDRVVVPNQTAFDPGSGSFAFAIWYRPTALPSGGPQVVCQLSDASTSGILLAQSGTDLTVYVASGAAVIPSSSYTKVLRNLRWHRIMVVADNDRDQVSMFVNGRLVQTVNVSSWTISPTSGWWFGYPGSLAAVTGQLQGFAFTKTRIDIDDAPLVARRDYFFAKPLPGQVGYELSDGSGASAASTVAGASAGVITGATWVASTQHLKPVDEGFDGKALDVTGALTTDATLEANSFVLIDPPADINLTLPDPSTWQGKQIIIRNTSGSFGAYAISPSGDIDGSGGSYFFGSGVRRFVSDGANVWVS